MIDNAVRAHLPTVTGPLLALYRALHLSPNAVTSIGLAFALGAAWLASQSHFTLALAAWWLSRIFDGTDGIYARSLGKTSAFGAYWDIVADMTAYGALVLGLAVAHPNLQAAWLVILFLYILCITSALALGMQEQTVGRRPRDNRGLRLGAGLAEAGETNLAYTIFLVLPAYLELSVWVWSAILALTVVARTALAYRLLAGHSS